MATYRITGIWKDSSGTITHYGVHTATKQDVNNVIGPAIKMTKVETIGLIENGNSAKTLLWDYTKGQWVTGEDIHVVDASPKYLRTNPDNLVKDNLLHLIDYGFVF